MFKPRPELIELINDKFDRIDKNLKAAAETLNEVIILCEEKSVFPSRELQESFSCMVRDICSKSFTLNSKRVKFEKVPMREIEKIKRKPPEPESPGGEVRAMRKQLSLLPDMPEGA